MYGTDWLADLQAAPTAASWYAFHMHLVSDVFHLSCTYQSGTLHILSVLIVQALACFASKESLTSMRPVLTCCTYCTAYHMSMI